MQSEQIVLQLVKVKTVQTCIGARTVTQCPVKEFEKVETESEKRPDDQIDEA